MPQYLSPGVYVEEVPSAVKAIAGVGTSTAGFISAPAGGGALPLGPGSTTNTYSLAPASQPQLITSWESFKNNFGDFDNRNKTLAHAVYGFFNNGGTRCWVARVAAGGPTSPPTSPPSGPAAATL